MTSEMRAESECRLSVFSPEQVFTNSPQPESKLPMRSIKPPDERSPLWSRDMLSPLTGQLLLCLTKQNSAMVYDSATITSAIKKQLMAACKKDTKTTMNFKLNTKRNEMLKWRFAQRKV